MAKYDYDAQIIGSGPNGLAAAILLAQNDLRVKVYESASTIGGGTRTLPLTLSGYQHDICSAIHPLAFSSPFLQQLPLENHGLEWVQPDIPLAHPLDADITVVLYKSLGETAKHLGKDKNAYEQLMRPLTEQWEQLSTSVLGPLNLTNNLSLQVQFALKALQPALKLAKSTFNHYEARALFAGLAAHSILPLHKSATSAIGLILGILGHISGWPFPKEGAQSITLAMVKYLRSLGGEIQTEYKVKTLNDLPSSKTYFFDTSPRTLAEICRKQLTPGYLKRIAKFRYGHGVFKIDAALSSKIPWANPVCTRAGTIHVGGTMEEIAASERCLEERKHAKKPYVLVAQQSLFDDSRAPDDNHTLWAYCHVPNGSTRDMTIPILNQIERFAPGFRDTVLEVHTTNTAGFESYNANYIGGDINGGAATLSQLFTRPVAKLNPYQTSAPDIYICSASTPPGGGVHGMCGYNAAKTALEKHF